MTAQQYITKMKGYASELATAGKIVDDDELKDYIMNGLDGSYNGFVAALKIVPSTTLNDMCSQLLSYENREAMLSTTGQASGSFMSSVNAAPRVPNPVYGGGPPRPSAQAPYMPPPAPTPYMPSPAPAPYMPPHHFQQYQPGPPQYMQYPPAPYMPPFQQQFAPPPYMQPYMPPQQQQRPPRPPQQPPQQQRPPRQDRRPKGGRKDRRATPWQDGVFCQICKKEGHPADECWWRYGDDDDEDKPPKETKGAYGVDTNWYIDTGATNHVTGQLNKLNVHEPYQGRDQVHNASGQGMDIAHIGHSSLHTLLGFGANNKKIIAYATLNMPKDLSISNVVTVGVSDMYPRRPKCRDYAPAQALMMKTT
jgi:hypothetical protein